MRFGCYLGIEQVNAAADAGYHFVELPVAALLPERPETEFRAVEGRLSQAPIRAEVWRLHLPRDDKLTGPEVDWPRLARYAYTAIRRAAAVGGAVISFCSGPARQVPADFPEAEAVQQVCEFLRVCGASARSQGLLVGIEPLAPAQSNLVNSLPEAVDLARRVDMPEVGVLASDTSILEERDCAYDVVDAAQWLTHVRVSVGGGPSAGTDRALGEFAHALRLADYDWRVSLTAEWTDPACELRAALERARRWFDGSQGDVSA